jgi:hypothetical protein
MISRQWRGLARAERADDWESLEAIRAFAGPDAETAVVPENVQTMMLEYDRRVRHYQVVE